LKEKAYAIKSIQVRFGSANQDFKLVFTTFCTTLSINRWDADCGSQGRINIKFGILGLQAFCERKFWIFLEAFLFKNSLDTGSWASAQSRSLLVLHP